MFIIGNYQKYSHTLSNPVRSAKITFPDLQNSHIGWTCTLDGVKNVTKRPRNGPKGNFRSRMAIGNELYGKASVVFFREEHVDILKLFPHSSHPFSPSLHISSSLTNSCWSQSLTSANWISFVQALHCFKSRMLPPDHHRHCHQPGDGGGDIGVLKAFPAEPRWHLDSAGHSPSPLLDIHRPPVGPLLTVISKSCLANHFYNISFTDFTREWQD